MTTTELVEARFTNLVAPDQPGGATNVISPDRANSSGFLELIDVLTANVGPWRACELAVTDA